MSHYSIAGYDTWKIHNLMDDRPEPSEEMYSQARAELLAEDPDNAEIEGSTYFEKMVNERAILIQDRYIENSQREARENGYE